ncbi:uncharacterized protein CDV56_100614 [Aspergillus thermomutatus]|uniref:Uncharacterized protein n=1 Tax=Aspergillus thermomutatus TaxID=41047 RepID=A0A397FXH7_ASPTH|nr:uncharacterized protein CDV56_100614 [Aspergillus thermomutatus]RHZ43462.1 hypothetical protein CDV56_100614 [Aspergillus thermomutatus]
MFGTLHLDLQNNNPEFIQHADGVAFMPREKTEVQRTENWVYAVQGNRINMHIFVHLRRWRAAPPTGSQPEKHGAEPEPEAGKHWLFCRKQYPGTIPMRIKDTASIPFTQSEPGDPRRTASDARVRPGLDSDIRIRPWAGLEERIFIGHWQRQATASRHSRHIDSEQLVLPNCDLPAHRESTDTSLDSTLAWQKEARTNCLKMLRCKHCNSRSDYMMLLTVVCDKLATLSGKVIAIYLQHCNKNPPEATRFPTPSCSPPKSSNKNPPNGMFVGNYEIDNPSEWSSVMSVLMRIQLRSLWSLMQEAKTVAYMASLSTQLAKLQDTEHRVSKLIDVWKI